MSLGPMMATPLRVILFLGSIHRSALYPFVWRALPRCNALTFWSGDSGASGVTSLLGGVALEARDCQSVMGATVVAREVEA